MQILINDMGTEWIHLKEKLISIRWAYEGLNTETLKRGIRFQFPKQNWLLQTKC